MSLNNWRVRWRLIAIIALPTVAAVILGSVSINSAVSNYTTFQRVENLARVNEAVVNLASAIQDERDTIAGFISASPRRGQGAVQARQRATNQAASNVQTLSQGITTGAGYDSSVVQSLMNIQSDIGDLPNIRAAALSTAYPALQLINRYSAIVTDMNTFAADIANGTGDIPLQTSVNELAALLRDQNDVSQQRGVLYAALSSPTPGLPPLGLNTLTQDHEQQVADESQFKAVASLTEAETFSDTVAGPLVDVAQAGETLATSKATQGQTPIIYSGAVPPPDCLQQGDVTQASCWYFAQSAQVNDIRSVSSGLVSDVSSRATSLTSQALQSAVITGALMLLLLFVVLVFTTIVARSMIRPLRKLRSDALEVAGTRLPDMVRRLSQSEGSDESIEIAPIGVSSTDEIGEVARAFDQVHREAVRLAADEAMLRGNLNSMFVNLSRRSQSLIERQLTLIDNLEQGEQDPDRLSSLFRLDHLATRMRRNSENLLVLAGHEASRRWSQPVPLVDVLRAAISEIEQYERVVLNVQPGIVVVGQAVNDAVHLVAELVENATTFSPEDTQVYVTGQPLSSGGVLLDITDNGVGVSDQEMAHANWRLDNPPVVDVAVSRRMGLFVVGRLAARHGVRVRLRHAQSGGLTALIWLPDSVAAPEGGSTPLGRLRKFEADDYGPAPSLSAPPPASAAPLVGGALGSAGPLAPPPFAGGPGPLGGGAGTGSFGAIPDVPAAPVGPAVPSGPDSASRIPRFPGTGPMGGADQGGMDDGEPAAPPAPQLPMRPAASSQPNGAVTSPEDQAASGLTSRMPAFGDTAGAPIINGNGSDSVTIPPAGGPAQDQRLPIFDSLESDWFRRSGKTLSSGPADKPVAQTWSSPADEGWRAAQVAASPSAGSTTSAGLPKRVPRANLVPGSVGGATGEGPEADTPSRTAEDVRSRMSSFQRGVREARAAGPQNEEP